MPSESLYLVSFRELRQQEAMVIASTVVVHFFVASAVPFKQKTGCHHCPAHISKL